MTATPTPIDRRLYGDLADDIVLLRSDGRIVARYKDGFRIDNRPEIFTAANVRGMAAELRNRRASRKPDSPRSPMARHEITRKNPERAASLPQGKPDQPLSKAADAGRPMPGLPTADVRDKFWRAVGPSSTKLQGLLPNAGDGGEPAATRCRPSPTTPAIDLCGCGRSFAHGGRCWFRRGWPGPDKGPTAIKRASEPARAARNGNIAALWAEVDALKSTVERMRKQLAMELGR